MKADLLFKRRVALTDSIFVELVLWQLPQPLPGSRHSYKYRLALVARSLCVLRYDNERGKGDHMHEGHQERLYTFTGIDALLADFRHDVERWLHENRDAESSDTGNGPGRLW